MRTEMRREEASDVSMDTDGLFSFIHEGREVRKAKFAMEMPMTGANVWPSAGTHSE